MHLRSELAEILSCLLPILCQTQTFGYPVQRRTGHSYIKPSTPLTASPYYNSLSNTSYKDSYYKLLAQRNSHSYSNERRIYGSDEQSTTKTENSRPYSNKSTWNSINRNYEAAPSTFSTSSSSNPLYSSSLDFLNTKKYLSNLYNSENVKKVSPSKSRSTNNKVIHRVSKADAENAKFAGAENQEDDEDGRTLYLKRRKFHRRFGGAPTNPCSPYGRDAGNGITPPPREQGRFLWDVNVYNIYPQSLVGLGCSGYGGFGGGLGGGSLSDPIGSANYPPGTGIANLLGLFVPGILQNSLAVTAPPHQFADYGQSSIDIDLQNDPEVDPNYRPGPASIPVRRPNSLYYDSAGAPPVTPAQLVGGISTTVNGIIQQLTGNVQPVYG